MKTHRFMIALTAINLVILIVTLVQTRSTAVQTVSSVLRARAIELVDQRGKVRAQLNVESNQEVVFRMRDAKGTIRVKLGANEDGSGLVLLDDRTEPTVRVRANRVGPSVKLSGRDGQERVIRQASSGCSSRSWQILSQPIQERRYTMNEVKLSSKNQIVIPREARDALRLKAGDKLLVVVRGDAVILLPKPKKYSKAIAAIGKGLYPSNYLESERENW